MEIEQNLLKDDFSIQNLLTFIGFFLSTHLLLRFITDFIGYYWVVDILLKTFVLVEASLPLAVSFFLNNTKLATRLRLMGIIVLIGYIFTILWS